MKKSIFILVLIFSCSGHSFERAWKSMLHYSPEGVSRIEKGANFFIHPKGFQNSRLELEATLSAFKDPKKFIKKYKTHPICAFPMRFDFLQSEFNLNIKEVNCNSLKKWMNTLGGDRVSVVLASKFISNPASVMGHSFIKIIDDESEDYINTALSYAADIPEDTGAWGYASKGLFGGFSGIFTTNRYYEKVHEYNNIERRDIWEYEINLSKKEVDLFIKHIWELKNQASIDYFFFDENCSYLILSIIEAVKGEVDLLSSFSTYVIPHETIKRLKEKNLIRKEIYRPSIRRRLLQGYKKLGEKEKKEVMQSLEDKKIKEDLSYKTLNTLIYAMTLKKYINEGVVTVQDQNFKDKALIQRAKFGLKPPSVISKPSSPTQSHNPMHLEFSQSHMNNSYELTYRPGVHRLDDSSAGYLKNSSFNFLEVGVLRYRDSTTLSKFTLFEVTNFVLDSAIDPQYSWAVKLGMESSIYSESRANYFDYSFGKTLELFSNFELHLLVKTKSYTSFNKRMVRTLGLDIIGTYRPSGKWTFFLEEEFLVRSLEGDSTLKSAAIIRVHDLFKNIDVRVRVVHLTDLNLVERFLLNTDVIYNF